MAKERKKSPHERNGKEEEGEEELQKLEEEAPSSKRDHERKSKRKNSLSSDDDGEEKDLGVGDRERKHSRSKKKRKSRSSRSRRRYSDEDLSSSSFDSDSGTSYSDSEFESSDYSSEESEGEDERRRRRKRKERKRKEREYEKERRRKRREKEKKGKKKDKDGKDKSKKKKKKSKSKEEKKGAVTNSWGKYGIIRETDMWNKRPEFTAWLSEVKQVNLETLPNWEEKQMFKQFMEDHNTATFPSKKYYSLDAYHRRQIEKEVKKGFKRANQAERTVFNDEEQRRLEMMQVREKQKEAEVETLKIAMQSGMAQAMKEQAQLREEMAYQYKLGNFEAAAAIQRRLDPDVPQ